MTTPGDPRERETAVTADVREEVIRRLDAVEGEEDVRVLYACESGSRAWGFASPDSDYDVRFIYVHRPDWYLSIADRRDVIERPIVGEYDLSRGHQRVHRNGDRRPRVRPHRGRGSASRAGNAGPAVPDGAGRSVEGPASRWPRGIRLRAEAA